MATRIYLLLHFSSPKLFSSLVKKVFAITTKTLIRLFYHSSKFLFHQGSQIFCNRQSRNRNINRSNILRLLSRSTKLGHPLLHSDVIGILTEEIRHSARIFGLQHSHIGSIFLIGHRMTEQFLPILIAHHRIRRIPPTPIGLNADLLPRLGFDGKFDFIEIRPLLPTRPFERLTARKFLIHYDTRDIVHGNIVKGRQKCQLVNRHVLQHSLGIPLEALPQTLRRGFIRIIRNEGDMRPRNLGGKLPGLSDVFANVFVVPHADLDVSVGCLQFHFSELFDGGRPGLFEVDDRTARRDGFAEKAGIVDRAAGDEGEALGGGGGLWGNVGEGFVVLDSVLFGGFGLEFGEFGSSWSVGSTAKKPRLDNVTQLGGRTFVPEHLHGVIPSHPAQRTSASD
mmetsp:Transcript_22057/g.44410  ORF Transcript_22057/g.44410 Transcript_22057/m.44410 type:complete len:395 (-) Transcript_22057:198-1382(-)